MIFVSFLLFVTMILYLRLARSYDIVDLPNDRSSHASKTVVRGGGIVIYVSVLVYSLIYGFNFPYLLAGISMVAMVSFLDDVVSVSRVIRVTIHFMALSLISIDLLNNWPVWGILIFLVVAAGILNAYNFMDGINGITGIYSLIALGSLLYFNCQIYSFTDLNLILCSIVAIIIFGFFNFRKNAICFMGDIGSISIAFLIVYLLTQLIAITGDLSFLLLLIIYGIDTVATIVERIIQKENILTPHRKHLYQYYANEREAKHLYIALIYSIIQLLINAIVIINYVDWHLPIWLISAIIVTPTMFIYLFLKCGTWFERIKENV